MGQRIGINMDPLNGTMVSPAKRSKMRFHLGLDLPLLVVVITLVIFGLLMVYSASADFSYLLHGSATLIFKKQIQLVITGAIIAFLLIFTNYHWWQRIAVPMMAVAILGLILVLILQEERLGAVRSIVAGSIQPSELAKFVVVIYLSIWLYSKRDNLRDVTIGLFPLGIILGVITSLIGLQPDLSAIITIVLIGTMLFFLAGGELRQVIIVFLIVGVVGFLILRSGIYETGTARVLSFWAGLRDPLNYSDHVRRSLEAFIKGGWFGVGIGKSQVKLYSLPFPHTDSIFAVVGEETGIIGAAFLLFLYSMIMWRGLVIARNAPNILGRLLAAGLSFWIVTEAFINMAVMVGLMPFAGNALPFISSGGSNMWVCLAAIGVIMSVARASLTSNEKEESTYHAVVDLRRRDRRRRVPRTVRSAGYDG